MTIGTNLKNRGWVLACVLSVYSQVIMVVLKVQKSFFYEYSKARLSTESVSWKTIWKSECSNELYGKKFWVVEKLTGLFYKKLQNKRKSKFGYWTHGTLTSTEKTKFLQLLLFENISNIENLERKVIKIKKEKLALVS